MILSYLLFLYIVNRQLTIIVFDIHFYGIILIMIMGVFVKTFKRKYVKNKLLKVDGKFGKLANVLFFYYYF
jgi:hypothetical protein